MKVFKNYKWSVDLLGVLLFALLILPFLVYWCIPDFKGIDGQKALAVAAYVFGALGAAALIALSNKERKPFSFFSLTGTLTWLFTVLSYVAWIFFFCNYNNVAVALFLAVCPCVALLAFEAERKNYVAVAPTACFALLRFIAVLLLWI